MYFHVLSFEDQMLTDRWFVHQYALIVPCRQNQVHQSFIHYYYIVISFSPCLYDFLPNVVDLVFSTSHSQNTAESRMPNYGVHNWIFSRLRLLTWCQLTGLSLNSHQNHNNLRDNGGHSLMITRQVCTKASNGVPLSFMYINSINRSRKIAGSWTPLSSETQEGFSVEDQALAF